MSVEKIKEELAALPRKQQEEVMAFLFHLRHAQDSEYQAEVTRRMDDKEPSHWLTSEQFEEELDKRQNG